MRALTSSSCVRPCQKPWMERMSALTFSETSKASPVRRANSSSSSTTQSMEYSGKIGAAKLREAWLPNTRESGST